MKSPLNILHLEDEDNDAELIQVALGEAGISCKITRVETQGDFVAALKKDGWDLILSDYQLPAFDGLAALSFRQKMCSEVPFILITGTLGEEMAVECLRSGATDYVLKEHLARLPAVVGRALKEAETIKARHQSEEALRQSEELFRLLLNSTAEAIHGLDLEGNCIFANPRCLEMLGYFNTQSLIGRNMHQLIHYKRADGSPYPAENCPLDQTFKSGIPSHSTEEVFWKANGTSFPVEYWSFPIRNGDKLVGTVVTFLDITDRKKLEEQFRQAQKMEVVGRLAGGVAHDFNNLLTVIMGYVDMLLEKLEPNDPKRSDAEEIQKAGERAVNLTRQLLTFSRRQVVQPQVIHLNQLISDMNKMLRRLISEDVELVIPASKDLWPVKVDPGQIEQVLTNLAVNARDAMPQGGKLTLETKNVTLSHDYVSYYPGLSSGDYILLSVTDTGSGMTQEVKERLFEPFFTTKGVGKGTGLGLATCFGIVKQAGGQINVYSELNHGTTFKIYLPRCQEASVPDSESRQMRGIPLLPVGSETILVVEDEMLVKNLSVRILKEQGYKVFEAGNGEEALQLIEKNSNHDISLIVTDLIMPQMGGKELAERLRKVSPHIKILFTSGYTDQALGPEEQINPSISFIQKPYSPYELALKIRKVLDKP